MSRCALVTGGARGIGLGISRALAREGIDLAIFGRRGGDDVAAVLDDLRGFGVRVVYVQGDIASGADRSRALAEIAAALGPIHILVNNAGVAPKVRADILEASEESFEWVLRTNLQGPYFLTQALLPLIADGGRILNVSSGLARFSLPGSSAYAMMKGGIEVFTRYLAKELGARGISANTLAPGAIETDFGGGRVRDDAQVNAMVSSVTAMGRPGKPDDIGPVAVALLSPQTAWVNAQRVEASGGMFV